jgi:hypothetical protein
MELASGYSDSINYGNGYTPLANNAIANNNSDYARNQAAIALMAQQAMNQHNAAIQAQGPSSGYGTVGGYPSFGEPSGPGSVQQPQQPQEDLVAEYYRLMGGGGGIGSDAARAPNQPDPTPQQWYTGGYNPYSPQTFAPSAQQNLGTPQPSAGSGQDPYQQWLQSSGGGGGGGNSFADRWGGMPSTYTPDFNTQQVPSGIFTGDFRGGGTSGGTPNMFDYFNPQTFAPSAQPNVGTGQPNVSTPGVFGTGADPYQQWLQSGGYNGGGAGMMASGGDTSWLGAGGTNNDYNPFGQINAGQVGQYDPLMGYQPQPTFDQRFNAPGQPYGPGYFDNTFGSVSQNGPGSFNSRFPAPNTPGMTSSDQSEAARQQAIRDLMNTLGTTVAPAYDPHVAPDVPSTLIPRDYQPWNNAS